MDERIIVLDPNLKYSAEDLKKYNKAIIKEGARVIPNDFLTNAKSIKYLELPEGLIEIGAFAFEKCAIEELVIPQTVMIIKYCAFSDCPNLKKIVFKGDDTIIEESVFRNSPGKVDMIFPANTESIPTYFYSYNSEFTFEKIQLPKSLKKICESQIMSVDIEELEIPDGVEEIERNAFYNLEKLRKVFIPKSVVKVGANILSECNCTVFIEGEITSSWCDEEYDVTREYEYISDEDYAFNFHRGPSSSTKTTVTEHIVSKWSHEGLKIITNASKEDYLKY